MSTKPTPISPEPEMTREQQIALDLLFQAHADKDPLRIATAEAHLEFVCDIQGRAWERRKAA